MSKQRILWAAFHVGQHSAMGRAWHEQRKWHLRH
jgi:hypothetical protein